MLYGKVMILKAEKLKKAEEGLDAGFLELSGRRLFMNEAEETWN